MGLPHIDGNTIVHFTVMKLGIGAYMTPLVWKPIGRRLMRHVDYNIRIRGL